ncbi:hypothetical protein ACX9NE_21405 [Mycobacterium sp. ML4]
MASPPRRITRSERLCPATLGPVECTALVDRLYGIYSETVRGDTREQFAANLLGASRVRLKLFFGADDELAGFAYLGLEHVQHEGRVHGILYGGAFFQLGYRGGIRGLLFGLNEACRFKIRRPGTPIAYVTRSSSPAAYRLLASTMPRIYPSCGCGTPAELEPLMRVVSARRRYIPVSDNPWIVRSAAVPLDALRLGRIAGDQDVRFFLERNAGFAQGEALLVWIPADAANIARGVFRLLRAQTARVRFPQTWSRRQRATTFSM